jgi:hypothetical protein
MAGIPKVKISFDADYSELKKGVKGAQDEVQSFGSKVADFGKKAAAAFAVAAVAAGAMAVKIGKDAIAAASDLSETISKVGVLFGDSAKQVEAFAETAAVKLGQSKQQALNAAATFATFGKAAGLAGDDLAKFSTDFVGLASDLASFNNTSPEQAINAIGAALRGESEPLRAYGVLLDDASLRQAALELGIVSTTKNALTPQQKVLAAQKLIYEQTGAAQGDFARTSDGLANSQRILSARIENVKTVIGEALLPIALKVSEFVSKTLLPIIEKLASGFDSGTGESLLGKISNVVDFVRDFFQPIWDAVIRAFGRVKDAIVVNKDNFSGLIDTLRQVFDWVNKYIIPIFKTQLVGAIEVASTAISLAIKAIVPIVKFVTDSVKTLINFVIDGINLLIKGYNGLARLLGKPTIALLSKIGETRSQEDYNAIAGVPAAFTGTTTTTTTAAASAAAGAAAGAAVGAAAGSAAKSTAKAVEKAAPTLIEEVIAANAAKLIPPGVFDPAAFRLGEARADAGLLVNGGAIPSTFDVAAARRGEMEQAPITINVNAPSIIDEEGFNRALQLAVNNSYYRGTGGGTALIT